MFSPIKLCTVEIELFICIKIDLSVNNLQKLICNKSQTSKQISCLNF